MRLLRPINRLESLDKQDRILAFVSTRARTVISKRKNLINVSVFGLTRRKMYLGNRFAAVIFHRRTRTPCTTPERMEKAKNFVRAR